MAKNYEYKAIPAAKGNGYGVSMDVTDGKKSVHSGDSIRAFGERGRFESMAKAKKFGEAWAKGLAHLDQVREETKHARRDRLPSRLQAAHAEIADLNEQASTLKKKAKVVETRVSELIREASAPAVELKLHGTSDFVVALAPNVSDGSLDPGGNESNPQQAKLPAVELQELEARKKKLLADRLTLNDALADHDLDAQTIAATSSKLNVIEDDLDDLDKRIADLKKGGRSDG